MSNEFVKGVTIGKEADAAEKERQAEGHVTDMDFTEEETRAQIRMNEEDFIQGLIAAADFAEEETQRIEIIRNKKLYFAFRIHPLSAEQYDNCRKKNTKYVRNRHMGMKVPDETDRVKYQSALIYAATVKEDREKLWDNKKVWDALVSKGLPIARGLDVIEHTMKAGEKDKVIEALDRLSGFDEGLEEVAKN